MSIKWAQMDSHPSLANLTRLIGIGLICLASVALAAEAPVGALPRLRVSPNHHFLVHDDGSPFFYLGDTAWEIFHRLNREEATIYLRNRADKHFTVIQAVVLAEFDGLHATNAYGHTPVIEDDPLKPNEEYFRHVDWIVREANRLGLYIGMLPTWGDKWNKAWGTGPVVFTPKNAAAYGEWLGKRYRDAGIIWILGGDRAVENEAQSEIIRRMALGLRKGDGGAHLITFHPTGGSGSSKWWHNEDWLDFNMRQNGHEAEYTGRYNQTLEDYNRSPAKPVIDGEPLYEDHPLSFKPDKLGYSVAADVRRPLYWDLFGGACGHTYGNHAVWQMYDPARRPPINNPLLNWQAAINQPGAGQMQYARKLLESRPFLTRIPDDSLLVPDPTRLMVPGAGTRRFVATRDGDGSYGMIYAPVGRKFRVDCRKLSGSEIRAWWFDPRTGVATEIGTFKNQGEHEFEPPQPGELLDWVLVLDDTSKHFRAPGM